MHLGLLNDNEKVAVTPSYCSNEVEGVSGVIIMESWEQVDDK